MNCDKPFDGLGGELAHSWAAGDIHFDDDEDYRSDQQLVDSGWSAAVDDAADAGGISLQKLAVHEVGHVLGLLHNDIQHSIMYPIYVSPATPEDFELVREDRQAVQQIYGVCKVLRYYYYHYSYYGQVAAQSGVKIPVSNSIMGT